MHIILVKLLSFLLLPALRLVVMVQLLLDYRPDIVLIVLLQRVYPTDVLHYVSYFVGFFDFYADVVAADGEDYLEELGLWLFDSA